MLQNFLQSNKDQLQSIFIHIRLFFDYVRFSMGFFAFNCYLLITRLQNIFFQSYGN